MILTLLLLPFIAALITFLTSNDKLRRIILVISALLHLSLVISAWFLPAQQCCSGWLALSSLELLFLTTLSTLFFAASLYAVGYLHRESKEQIKDFKENFFFSNAHEANFTSLLLIFQGSMSLAILSQHIGLMWVAVEATTLASAPLICYHRHHRSLEATWKYLLICSVGIGLALLGNFFLVVAMHSSTSLPNSHTLTIENLLKIAPHMDMSWLKATFIIMLVGYGTKMGLAPLHTWLPDAHSEAPSLISALLSGALLNCALIVILRMHSICVAASLGTFSGHLLILLGLISMATAAIFIISQKDYKRLLAYSSVEHMGLIALGVGVGGLAAFGSLLHVINHSAIKGLLFFASGNLLATYRTREVDQITGLLKTLPITALLWLFGLFMISGFPPFGSFISEFSILKGAFDHQLYLVLVLAIIFLIIIFIGMAKVFLTMVYGEKPKTDLITPQSSPLLLISPIALGIIVLILGLYLPAALSQHIHESLAFLRLL